MKTIRAQRKALKEMRTDSTLTPSQYRLFYRKAKGGSYRSVAHLKSNIELEGIDIGGEA
jgi:large subunit ribosomal protein L19e